MRNFIDKLIEPFAPGTVVSRLAARQAIQRGRQAQPQPQGDARAAQW